MTPYQLLQHFVFTLKKVWISEYYINSLGVKTHIAVHNFEDVNYFSDDFPVPDCFYKGKIFRWFCYHSNSGDLCLHIECVNSLEVMS